LNLTQFDEYYWREQLDQVMNSLPATFFVIALVLIDMIQLVYFNFILLSSESTAEPIAQIVLTCSVLACFTLELSLRRIGTGRRYWKDNWNIFDFVVVLVSVAVYIVKYTVEGLISGNSYENYSLDILRLFSRLAVGLRVMRVVLNLGRAHRLSGKVTHQLRITVSQNRRRYKKHGFDLDLTYITNRIIAMSAPAFGGHSAYRNDIHVVSRFLSYRHYGHIFIFNLCDTYYSSDGVIGNYNPKMFFSQVLRIPMEDHAPPMLVELLQFCSESAAFLQSDVRNVVAVHCKGGKGRTGVCVASALLWSGHRRSAIDALELFTFRRTQNYDPELGLESTMNHHKFNLKHTYNQSVESPSQIRYVHYVEAILYCGVDPYQTTRMNFESLSLTVGAKQQRKPWYVSFTVKSERALMFSSETVSHTKAVEFGGKDGDVITFPINTVVWGDVRIDCWIHKGKTAPPKKRLFFCVWNTNFYPCKSKLEFPKRKLDILSKDKNHIKTDENFHLTLRVDSDPQNHEQLRVESTMREILMQFGKKVVLAPGEVISWRSSSNEPLYLVTEGHLDGVIDERDFGEESQMKHHPLGRGVETWRNDNCRCKPNLLVAAKGHIVGSSKFLSRAKCFDYVATAGAEVYELKRREVTPQSSGSGPAPISPEGRGLPMHRQTSWLAKRSASIHLRRTGTTQSTGFKDDNDSNFQIVGMSMLQLSQFYRGLAINLAMQLSKVRIEAIRISECKGFNDQQTLMHEHDETERIRASCIKTFHMPMMEKVCLIMKCSVQSADFNCSKCRLIILSTCVVLDPEYFGPEIGINCATFPISDLLSVSPNCQYNSLVVTTAGRHSRQELHGRDFVFSFFGSPQMAIVYKLVSEMCVKAEMMRERGQFRPFETPAMSRVMEKCTEVHNVRRGERLQVAEGDSLFLVRSGELRLTTTGGETFQIVLVGGVFGATSFALQQPSCFITVATAFSTVVEIRQQDLNNMVKMDHMLGARFYFVVCKVIEQRTREIVEATFPGTWTQKEAMLSSSSIPGQKIYGSDRDMLGFTTSSGSVQ